MNLKADIKYDWRLKISTISSAASRESRLSYVRKHRTFFQQSSSYRRLTGLRRKQVVIAVTVTAYIDFGDIAAAAAGWLVDGCLTSQQHGSVSQGRICSDNFTCCHTEIEVADPNVHLTQSQYTDTGPISPSTDPITPDAWQGSHWSTNFEVTGMTRPRKNPGASGIRTRDLPLSRRTP